MVGVRWGVYGGGGSWGDEEVAEGSPLKKSFF